MGLIAVYGDPFEPHGVRVEENLPDIFPGRGLRQIDGFGDRIVRVALKCGLDLQVPLRSHIPGALEHLFGDRFLILQIAGIDGMDVIVKNPVDTPLPPEGKDGFYAAADTGNQAQTPCRGHSGQRGVALQADAPFGKDAVVKTGEIAAHPCQGRRCRLGTALNLGHDPIGHGHGPVTLVGDVQQDQHVGKAHDPQSDLTGAAACLFDLPQRIVVDFDDVVQEMDGRLGQPVKFAKVDLFVFNHLGQVDGSQSAGFIGQKGLFTAGVGGANPSHPGDGIILVDTVDKKEARISGLPG